MNIAFQRYGPFENEDMESELPPDHGIFEIEEPTQPYSRGQIERMRQLANIDHPPAPAQESDPEIPESAQPSTPSQLPVAPNTGMNERSSSDTNQDMEEWFELEGRWLRVSLQAFEHFGTNGTPPGMIGSLDACFVSGTINWQEGAPVRSLPRLTEVYEAPEPEPELDEPRLFSHPRKRRLWATLVASPLALGVAVWVFAHTGAAQEQDEKQDLEPAVIVVADAPAVEEPTVTVAAPVTTDSASEVSGDETNEVVSPRTKKSGQPKSGKGQSASSACIEHRESATRARDSGKWALLEDLAKRRNCWARTSEAKALQMRALFELERFEECVRLGAQGGPKEIQTWVSNCQRALE